MHEKCAFTDHSSKDKIGSRLQLVEVAVADDISYFFNCNVKNMTDQIKLDEMQQNHHLRL